ncbi:hypothetical protein NDU88_001007 [Pleurodeles waltl]|uniref:Uncharacterized protein n=1 Tax=Pleurodeles waltl TaxID=8319 RepID=A0AAV7N9K6_PLEWA|nr:hypothetical protein NDU88_001007 [Pleurodeles waltl]
MFLCRSSQGRLALCGAESPRASVTLDCGLRGVALDGGKPRVAAACGGEAYGGGRTGGVRYCCIGPARASAPVELLRQDIRPYQVNCGEDRRAWEHGGAEGRALWRGAADAAEEMRASPCTIKRRRGAGFARPRARREGPGDRIPTGGERRHCRLGC